jgi:hypothetical protein
MGARFFGTDDKSPLLGKGVAGWARLVKVFAILSFRVVGLRSSIEWFPLEILDSGQSYSEMSSGGNWVGCCY